MKKFMKNAKLLGLLLCLSAALVCAAAVRLLRASRWPNPSQPSGKHVPQAKTKAEFNDYNTAYAVAGGAASEKAADEFSAKYPDSELKSIPLFQGHA